MLQDGGVGWGYTKTNIHVEKICIFFLLFLRLRVFLLYFNLTKSCAKKREMNRRPSTRKCGADFVWHSVVALGPSSYSKRIPSSFEGCPVLLPFGPWRRRRECCLSGRGRLSLSERVQIGERVSHGAGPGPGPDPGARGGQLAEVEPVAPEQVVGGLCERRPRRRCRRRRSPRTGIRRVSAHRAQAVCGNASEAAAAAPAAICAAVGTVDAGHHVPDLASSTAWGRGRRHHPGQLRQRRRAGWLRKKLAPAMLRLLLLLLLGNGRGGRSGLQQRVKNYLVGVRRRLRLVQLDQISNGRLSG